MDYKIIENWSEDDLLNIPSNETDFYEYKSSKIQNDPHQYKDKLKKYIVKAASAFWNTGGGIFIVGVDDNGKIDGGIQDKVGNQKISDWVDSILQEVQPTGAYGIKVVHPTTISSAINPNHVVLVISFSGTSLSLHMAPDNKYYLRAGAHSIVAGHYLVEALRARKSVSQPILRAVLRTQSRKPNTVELLVITLNDTPALDVELTFEPMPKRLLNKLYGNPIRSFPLKIPVIDKNNPFQMDFIFRHEQDEMESTYVVLSFFDVISRHYEHRQLIDPMNSFSPLELGTDVFLRIEKSLGEIAKRLK